MWCCAESSAAKLPPPPLASYTGRIHEAVINRYDVRHVQLFKLKACDYSGADSMRLLF